MADGFTITLPLHLSRVGESYAIQDAAGVSIAHVYFEDQEQRRSVLRRLSSAEAKEVARTMARALTEAVQNAKKAPPA